MDSDASECMVGVESEAGFSSDEDDISLLESFQFCECLGGHKRECLYNRRNIKRPTGLSVNFAISVAQTVKPQDCAIHRKIQISARAASWRHGLGWRGVRARCLGFARAFWTTVLRGAKSVLCCLQQGQGLKIRTSSSC